MRGFLPLPPALKCLRRPAVQYYHVTWTNVESALELVVPRVSDDLRGLAAPISSQADELGAWLSTCIDEKLIGYKTPTNRLLYLLRMTGILTKEQSPKRLPPPPPDWSKLPAHLAFLSSAAEKYGNSSFDSAIDELVETATPADRAELLEIRGRMDRDGLWGEVDIFELTYPESHHRETQLLRRLLGPVLDSLAWPEPTADECDEPDDEVESAGESETTPELNELDLQVENEPPEPPYDPFVLPDPIDEFEALGRVASDAGNPKHLIEWASTMLFCRGSESKAEAAVELLPPLLKCCIDAPWNDSIGDFWYRAVKSALVWDLATDRGWLLNEADEHATEPEAIARLASRLLLDINR